MDDLIAFVRRCLDEDERVIRDAADDYFYSDGHDVTVNRWFDRWSPDSPDRMLAEIEAKRRHIARWQEVDTLLTNTHDPSAIRNELLSVRRAYILVIQDDAQPYAGQPGWREEWLT
jgi:hypothetical protein